jgi:phage shock protein C
MIAGVCGGLGEYLGIDPIFVRIFFFILLFETGIGFWLYVLLWFMIPYADAPADFNFNQRMQTVSEDFVTAVNQPDSKIGLLIGAGLVFLGGVWLIESLDIPWLWWFDFDYLWPLLLIIAGGVLIYRFVFQRE